MSFSARTEKLIGKACLDKLAASSVLLVGLGGVGGIVFEMLVRVGIGKITVVDCDRFEGSNLNRQILCLNDNIGQAKTSVAVIRAQNINPNCSIIEKNMRYCKETASEIFCERFDYVVDCIDSIEDKADLIIRAESENIPVISAMGSGNRINPQFVVTDIFSTQGDGLARIMRKKLREAGISKLKTVCDSGLPLKTDGVPGTISYAPNLMGCIMSQEIITDLLWKE